MHVHVTVEVPRQLTKKQKELLEQLAATMGEAQSPKSTSFFDKVRTMFSGDDTAAEARDADESTG